MRFFRNACRMLFPVLAASFAAAPAQQQAVQSDVFVNSVGVDVHLHYTDTLYYKNFPLIRDALVAMGVKHIRDGVEDTNWQGYYDEHNLLGSLGIKGTFTTSPGQSYGLLSSWPSRVPQSYEGYENANEYDLLNNWVPIALGSIPTVYFAAKAQNPQGVVFGPALTQEASYPLLGYIGNSIDFASMHNYFGGRNPGTPGWGSGGYGSIAYNIARAQLFTGNKPVVTTETGYRTDTTATNYVSEAVQAKYMPRMLLEQFNAGVVRTYIYELLSEGGEEYGLMRPDGSRKPAFNAVANLLNILADGGSSFTPAQLTYNLNGADSNVHRLLLQKRDGSFWLALWVEASGYDPDQHFNINVPSQQVTLESPNQFAPATVYQWDDGGNVGSATIAGGSAIPLTITDKLMIVKLSLPTQSCSYTFGSSSLPFLTANKVIFSAGGGSGTFSYTAPSGCADKATSSASWLTVSASNGVVSMSAAPNTGGFRDAVVTLGSSSFLATQAGNGFMFVQVQSNIPNSWVGIDGFPVVSGSWLTWRIGEGHLLSGFSPQRVNGLTYYFQQWTSGLSGSNAAYINAPATTTVYTSQLAAQ